ncbi:MAG TPA: endonuclease/exonuclease/phosphatase family protein [Actinocrinis sp.]|nr:endonuclease/exonuclease/phosphatase family protein [Actinocrinis sp.]
MTFNVLHGRPMRDGRPVPEAGETGQAFAEAVAALDADVLALQELDRLQERSGRVDQAALAAEAMGARDWRYASALHGRPAPGAGWVLDPAEPGLRVHGPRDARAASAVPSHGIALLTRLPVHQWRARRFAAAPVGLPLRVAGQSGLTKVPDHSRAALAAVLEGGTGPFTVVALHLSFVPGWNTAHLAAVRRWIADLPAPHLLLGDFNLPGPLPRAVLGTAGLLDGAARAGRRSRAEARPPAPDGWRDLARVPTYPSHRPVVQFDHVLASGIPESSVQAVHTPLTPVSDHRPLAVHLAC